MKKLVLAPVFLILMALPVQAVNWQTVATYTRTGTTDYFSIPTSEWRIDWTYTPDSQYPAYAAFSFFVYLKGETALYIESVYKTGANDTSGTTYVHQGPGEYYLRISEASTQALTVTVQYDADAPAIPEFPLTLTLMLPLLTVLAVAVIVLKKKDDFR